MLCRRSEVGPQFGLNVHGKVFYFLITAAGLETITDRNVHDRLVLATGAAYVEWPHAVGPGLTPSRSR